MLAHLRRHWWKWLLSLTLAPIALVLLLGLALYIPSVQDWLVQSLERKTSESLGMQVHIGKLRVGFPLELSAEQVAIERSPRDTMLHLGRVGLSLMPIPLLERQAIVPHIALDELYYHDVDSLGTSTSVRLKTAELEHLRLDLKREDISASHLVADGLSVDYFSADTTSKPPSEALKWKIKLGKLSLSNSQASITMPRDSLYISTKLQSLSLHQISADLLPMHIELGRGELKAEELSYSVDGKVSRSPYMDYQRIQVQSLNIALSKLISEGKRLDIYLQQASARERCGLAVEMLSGVYQMNELRMRLSDLRLKTQHSSLKGDIDIPWKMFERDTFAILELDAEAVLALQDIRSLAGSQLKESLGMLSRDGASASLFDHAIQLKCAALGTLNDMDISSASLSWAKVLDLDLDGDLHYLLEDKRRRGQVSIHAQLGDNAQSLLHLIDRNLTSSYRLPSGLKLKGKLDISRHYFDLQATIQERESRAKLKGQYNNISKQYKAQADLHQLDLRSYMPKGELGLLTATLNVSGQGFEPLSPHTHTQLMGRITTAEYQAMQLRDITLDGSLKRGVLNLMLNSFNPGLNFSLLLDGLLSKREIQTSIVLDSEDLDFKALGLSSMDMSTKFRLQGELRSDLKDTHTLLANVENMHFKLDGDSITPEQVDLQLATNPLHSTAKLRSGDLALKLDLQEAPSLFGKRAERIAELTQRIVSEVQNSKPMTLRLEQLVSELPALDLDIELGKNNALRPYLAQHRLAVERLEGQIRLRPSYGLEGHLTARDLRSDTLRLSCIDLALSSQRIARPSLSGRVESDSMRMQVDFKLDKMRFRSQEGFSISSHLDASLQDALLSANMRNERGELQHALHLGANWSGNSYRIHIPSEYLMLSGQKLHVNTDNSLSLRKSDYFADADLKLEGERGGLLKLLAQHSEGKRQEATLSIVGIRLEDFRAFGLPDLSGSLVGDINYLREGNIGVQPTINGEVNIQHLNYEAKALGHFATAFFYEPRNDNSHYITAEVSYKGEQALAINGIYAPKASDHKLKGTVQLINFPLELANPFSAPYSTYLSGSLSGSANIAGTPTKPTLLGSISPQQASVELREYATTLQLDSLPLTLEGDRINFDNYAIRSSVDPKNPIYLNGSIRTSGEQMLTTDLRLLTQETTILNQPKPKSDTQLLYGRLIASADIRLSGKLNALRVRGQLGISSGTNCSYILRESGLDATDKSVGLVKFTDFADTIFLSQPPLESNLGGIDLNLGIKIDPSVRFNVDLTADGKDYVRMQGGGSMQLRYLPYGEMTLRGRYEMGGGGSMQYTLPIVGSKLFGIDPSSYIAFDGDVRNPYVYLTATQKVRASTGDASGTKTNFLVSIKLRDKVEHINLSFDLSAPENLNLQNSLVAMTSEERGKQAIGLLATGAYLAGNSGKNNFNLNDTFASLLESQINSMTGNLLSGTDLSIGMENDGTAQNQQTSYTYSFSRRFYNDRIRIVVGGKIQTGQTVSAREQSLIDNVAVEYQLDKAGERFLQVYHKRITDNVIEGEYSETGLGVLLRRKLKNLSDLFNFGKKKAKTSIDTLQSKPMITDFTLPASRE